MDLRDLGFSVHERGRWFLRPSGPGPEATAPPELSIESVTDAETLREFEVASIEGFESPGLHRIRPLGLHAPAILDDPRMRVFVGRVDGRAVAAAMAYVGDSIVGVYGVATLPDRRRRGYGQAMAWRATLSAALPAMLQPSPMAEATYRRMGYGEIGRFLNWGRPPD
jgi:hypothetical protein